MEALTHGGIHHGVKVKINWIPAETVTPENVEEKLKGVNGIVVPGGFGSRGLEGKMNAIQYVRENNIPFLGLCLGMQMAVIEFARHVLELRDAHTSEVDPHTTYPVIDLMAGQDLENLGGTMRLGKYHCVIAPGTKSEKAYGETNIWERHRHRYEFNNEYTDRFNRRRDGSWPGAIRSATWWRLLSYRIIRSLSAYSFHPELKSRPNRPHPLFRDFIGAAVKNKAE